MVSSHSPSKEPVQTVPVFGEHYIASDASLLNSSTDPNPPCRKSSTEFLKSAKRRRHLPKALRGSEITESSRICFSNSSLKCFSDAIRSRSPCPIGYPDDAEAPAPRKITWFRRFWNDLPIPQIYLAEWFVSSLLPPANPNGIQIHQPRIGGPRRQAWGAAFTPLHLTHTNTRRNFPTLSSIRPLKRAEARAPSVSSIRSEIFVATRATPFPSPVGAASFAERGVHAASPHGNQPAPTIFKRPRQSAR